MKKIRKTLKEGFKETALITLMAGAIFLLANIFIGELMVISGNSMEPNFHDKEQILAEKVTYKFSAPQRGQIVVVKHPETRGRLVIKRIIGLPEETLLISHNQLFINGAKVNEPYLPQDVDTKGKTAIADGTNFKIPEDGYVVMGDNREDSIDSREWGPVEAKHIVGRAILVYYPLKDFRFIIF